MTTTAPEAAMLTALSVHLRARLAATPDFAASVVVDEWPEPTVDLQLDQTRIVLAVTRAGKAPPVERVGGAQVQKVTLGTSPVGTVRYEYGSIELPIAIGLWAKSEALRDDADLFVQEELNKPYWSTVSPLVNTTLSIATTKLGEQWITPASMVDVWPGNTLDLDAGALKERVIVRDIRATMFKAVLTKTHAPTVAIVEVAGRRETTAMGLHLRCANHYSNVAHFVFDESPQTLDDAEGGHGSQRQEWRSIRGGHGSVMWSRDIANVVLQKRLFTQAHVSTTGGTVTNPKVVQVY